MANDLLREQKKLMCSKNHLAPWQYHVWASINIFRDNTLGSLSLKTIGTVCHWTCQLMYLFKRRPPQAKEKEQAWSMGVNYAHITRVYARFLGSIKVKHFPLFLQAWVCFINWPVGIDDVWRTMHAKCRNGSDSRHVSLANMCRNFNSPGHYN